MWCLKPVNSKCYHNSEKFFLISIIVTDSQGVSTHNNNTVVIFFRTTFELCLYFIGAHQFFKFG